MNTIEKLREQLEKDYGQRNELAEWLSDIDVNFTHAVTLTFGKNESDFVIRERTLGIFLHYLNKKVYRRAYTKGDKRIKVLATLEGLERKGQRPHFHLAVKMPGYITEWGVRQEIQHCWDMANKVRESQRDLERYAKENKMTIREVTKLRTIRTNRIDIRPYKDKGWINYIVKEFGITNTDCLSEHCYF